MLYLWVRWGGGGIFIWNLHLYNLFTKKIWWNTSYIYIFIGMFHLPPDHFTKWNWGPVKFHCQLGNVKRVIIHSKYDLTSTLPFNSILNHSKRFCVQKLLRMPMKQSKKTKNRNNKRRILIPINEDNAVQSKFDLFWDMEQ